MVHVYNCHPFSSQQIVQVKLNLTDADPVSAVFYYLRSSSLLSLSTLKNLGFYHCLLCAHSLLGDYLVTIEEKNNATYLRAYTNWRYQAEEKARVGVRLLGHLLGGASVWGGVQMEIIEIPLSERPIAVSCCPVRGDLLVGSENTLVLFTLRQHNHQNLSVLDFERSVILHLPKFTPKQVLFFTYFYLWLCQTVISTEYLEDQADFLVVPRHQELLGDRAKDCDIPVSIEKTGLEEGRQYALSYVLFRHFSPEFFQGCSMDEMQLHSLQLYPLFTGEYHISVGSVSPDEATCVFCFFSLPTTGYLYSLKGGVELLSAYQYPEKVLEAALTDHLLHVITNALQCFTVRCAALAARIEDPYIDTTMKACPPSSLEVCALRMQLFIGLRSMCVYGRHVILLSAADAETPGETERGTQRRGLSRRWTVSSTKESRAAGHGWNLYVVDTVTPFTLYQEMVEYSQRYAETNPQAQSLRHLLSEAHLLLRAALLHASDEQQTGPGGPADHRTDRQVLEEALRENCAQLGDSFSRGGQKECHLALPYYRMSGLSLTEVMSRNRPFPGSPSSYGPGFLFYLKHFLLEDSEQTLSQEAADQVIDIFSQSEPVMLISVCTSPCMINVSPARTLQILQNLEDSVGVSVSLTITMATMMLRLGDLQQYTQLMERHAEMLLVYGFIEEPRLLLYGGCANQHRRVYPTALTRQMADSQPGLLVAAMVALHENSKVKLEEADHIFKVLLAPGSAVPGGYLQVDFWEAMLMASSNDAVIQELLFRLASVYIDRLTNTKSENSLFMFLYCSCLCVQSLLCGPSLSVGSVVPLLERLSDETLWGFSLHLLCATRRGQYDRSIEKLLDRCPQAIIPYANHQLQEKNMALWWQKLLPELCDRTRVASDNSILLAALKETLVVVAMEMSPAEFLELIPDDGTASYFLPHLLTCSQRQVLA
uniref:HPS3 biogenesis of lysosomal organelles complex 2 subunit 1 n=1 Tax=Neolamprologus brichardi TaxID=32507 RepID=A0A3Q4HZT5_NEOBR